jgi:hypothetical protein
MSPPRHLQTMDINRETPATPAPPRTTCPECGSERYNDPLCDACEEEEREHREMEDLQTTDLRYSP